MSVGQTGPRLHVHNVLSNNSGTQQLATSIHLLLLGCSHLGQSITLFRRCFRLLLGLSIEHLLVPAVLPLRPPVGLGNDVCSFLWRHEACTASKRPRVELRGGQEVISSRPKRHQVHLYTWLHAQFNELRSSLPNKQVLGVLGGERGGCPRSSS